MKKKIIIFIVALSCLCSLIACDSDEEGTFKGKLYRSEKAKTAKGAQVFSANKINKQLLPKIDEGLDQLFRIASSAPNNYQSLAGHDAYKVYLFPRSNKCTAAGFLVNADGSPYDGTDYDKDPRPGIVRLCVAGAMVDGFAYGMLVVDDLQTMKLITRYEGEHIVLLHHDPERFVATQYHTENGHPIMPDQDGSLTDEQLSVESKSLTLPENITLDNEIVASKGAKACLLLTK